MSRQSVYMSMRCCPARCAFGRNAAAFNRFIRDARLFSALVVSGTQGNRSCEDSRRKRDSRMDCLSDAYQRAQDYTLRESTFVVVLACV